MLTPMAGPQKLPHAYPFRFIPREEDSPRLVFAPASDDAAGRGGPVPPWVVLEALAQAAGLLYATEGSGGGAVVQVAGYRCPRPVWPGDVLELRGTLQKRMGPLLRVRMRALRGGRLAASGTLTLREAPP